MCVCCRYFKETVITFSSTFHIRHAVGGRPFKFTGCQPFVIKDTNLCSGWPMNILLLHYRWQKCAIRTWPLKRKQTCSYSTIIPVIGYFRILLHRKGHGWLWVDTCLTSTFQSCHETQKKTTCLVFLLPLINRKRMYTCKGDVTTGSRTATHATGFPQGSRQLKVSWRHERGS